MSRWTADFETTTQKDDCRVWAWIVVNVDKPEEFYIDNDIATFIDFLGDKKHGKSKKVWFHNLAFDGEFIFNYILRNNFEWIYERKYLKNNRFTTLISDTGKFYSIDIMFNDCKCQIMDSLKLLNSSVEKIAHDFKLPISKLSIDYRAKREQGHILTDDEKAYILNDAKIMALALKQLFDQGFTKMTAGSNALKFYKNVIGGEKQFRDIFPVINCDDFIRKSYKGGFTYLNEKYANRDIGQGQVYDVNSLYPSVLHSPYLYPYGQPEYYLGKYDEDKKHPLFVQRFRCSFEVKENYLPTIQIKTNRFAFIPTEYCKSSKDIEVELTLTCVDLKLFLEHYDVYNMAYIDGYKFKAKTGLFDEYIDTWYQAKTEAKKTKNAVLSQLAKLLLNSLYGKFATNPKVQSKAPYLGEDGIVHYRLLQPETREPLYIPVGTFVTSYARNVTIRAAQKCYDRFIYADTDSLHLIGNEKPPIDVDQYKLGAFKLESIFTKAKFLRSKLYMEYGREPDEPEGSEEWKITGAGMPDSTKKLVEYGNFDYGSTFGGKLRPLHVPGGIVLVDTEFTIRT